jgi:cardiolipin synthase
MVAVRAHSEFQHEQSVSGLFKHVPNLLTGLRLAAAPTLAVLLVSGADRAALGVFAFAGLSDAADGFLAKRFGFATQFGRYLDPAADKVLMLVSFIVLTALGFTPLWLTVLVIARDAAIVLGILVGRMLDLPMRVEPLFIGKACTLVQVAYVAMTLLFLSFGILRPDEARFAAYIAALFTTVSWLGYGIVLVKALMARYRRAA